MLSLLASSPYNPMPGINLYYHEAEALWLALASLCIVVSSVYRALRKRNVNSEPNGS